MQDCGPLVRTSPAPGRGALTEAGGGVGAVLDSALGLRLQLTAQGYAARCPNERGDKMTPLRSERHFPRQLVRLLPIRGLFPPAPRRPAPSTVTSVQDAVRPTPLALSGARLGSSLGQWGGGRCGEMRRDGGLPSLAASDPVQVLVPKRAKSLRGVEVRPSPCSEPRGPAVTVRGRGCLNSRGGSPGSPGWCSSPAGTPRPGLVA